MSEPRKRKVLTWRSVMEQLEKKGETVVIVRRSKSGVKVYSTSNLSDEDVDNMLRRAVPNLPSDPQTSDAESRPRLPPAEQLLPHRRKTPATDDVPQPLRVTRLACLLAAAVSAGAVAVGMALQEPVWLAIGTTGLGGCLALLIVGRMSARRSGN